MLGKRVKSPIGTRWITRKHEVNPQYMSRLSVQEITRDKHADLFAATPPFAAKKLLR